ncbi:antibiotic biosynthesis monooxygenase [Acidicapsa dinghuensis]|uniref:Antibiotic biosynthesis monooxygenase n=1 Tax=Acidicapsa dinghuensis TaxID=2218256 RepID=A0ABW1EFN1_9BACT|nr:antibiotic biosynthesis monooxygenase [Acidicapsa dinghuensis]
MKPVTQINFISIKSDKIDEFFEADRSFVASATLPKGLIGSRLYKSPDGKSAARVTQYESAEAQHEYHRSEALQQQIALLRTFVESSTAGIYEEVRTTGDFN